MKTSSSKAGRQLCIIAVSLWLVPPWATAQNSPVLSIQAYAGLTITGSVGAVYTVQYLTNLVQSNDWRAVGIVQLPNSPYLWVDFTAPVIDRRFYRTAAGPTNMIWIPPGTFTMGSPSNEIQRLDPEGPQTVVTLTRGFFMGKYEVTQGEYLSLMATNPSYFKNGVAARFGGSGGAVSNALLHPVEQVTWFDATNYCTRLTARERSSARLPEGWEYRLPTEAEWEYACRSGTTSALHYGPALRAGMANFYGRQEYDSSAGTIENLGALFVGRTREAGRYEPNGWGLYDMHGNVVEWCLDGFDFSPLPGGRVTDPQGPPTDPARIFRGGGWYDFGYGCRSAVRAGNGPSGSYDFVGFRVVLAQVR